MRLAIYCVGIPRQLACPFVFSGNHSITNLAEALRLSVFLKAEGWEVHAAPEHFRLCENANTTNTVNLHLHVWVAVWVAEVSQMRTPCRILSISLDDDSVFIEGVC